MTPQEIISDEEITRVHGYANFGSMTPRQVVNDGVHKYAIGYTGGSTQVAILREHGLITATKNAAYRANLTQKGKAYARSINLYDLANRPTAQLSAALQVPEVAALVERRHESGSHRIANTSPQSRVGASEAIYDRSKLVFRRSALLQVLPQDFHLHAQNWGQSIRSRLVLGAEIWRFGRAN